MDSKPEAFLDRGVVTRNFVIWTIVCSLFAAYCFVVALGMKFNPWAMVLGVECFVVFYTVFSSTTFYQRRIRKNKALFAALVIAFVIKLAVIFPVDYYVGVTAVGFVESIVEASHGDFGFTLLITLAVGIILNLMIWIMIPVIYAGRVLIKTSLDDRNNRNRSGRPDQVA